MAERWVFGLQPVREAIRAHAAALHQVLVARSSSGKLLALERFARDQGVLRIDRVARGELDRLSRGGHHQGVACLAPPLEIVGLSQLLAGTQALMVMLDGITDPQNFGAAIRSAVALGDGTVLWGEHHAAPLTPATFRASAGAVEHARLCRVHSLRDGIFRLEQAGVQCVALHAGASTRLADLDLSPSTVLVIGAEDRGVGRAERRACSHLARLSMSGRLDSLNASVSVALALYEARRQRGLA